MPPLIILFGRYPPIEILKNGKSPARSRRNLDFTGTRPRTPFFVGFCGAGNASIWPAARSSQGGIAKRIPPIYACWSAQYAEFIIGRAFARPVGSCALPATPQPGPILFSGCIDPVSQNSAVHHHRNQNDTIRPHAEIGAPLVERMEA